MAISFRFFQKAEGAPVAVEGSGFSSKREKSARESATGQSPGKTNEIRDDLFRDRLLSFRRAHRCHFTL
jgi:hypothetical protein